MELIINGSYNVCYYFDKAERLLVAPRVNGIGALH